MYYNSDQVLNYELRTETGQLKKKNRYGHTIYSYLKILKPEFT